MTIKDKILIIKQRLRLDMNGVASKSMRDGGIGYGLNFGVGLAALKEIAGETEHDSSLAIALWKENVRECKMTTILPAQFDVISNTYYSSVLQNFTLLLCLFPLDFVGQISLSFCLWKFFYGVTKHGAGHLFVSGF